MPAVQALHVDEWGCPMNRLLLNLSGVPSDERNEVRELLEAHRIAFYETQAGAWGITLSGLWVSDADYPRARTYLNQYQQARSKRIRAANTRRRAQGKIPGFWRHFRQHPLRVILSLLAIVVVLILTLW